MQDTTSQSEVLLQYKNFYHVYRTCDCKVYGECNQGQRCHKYDDVKCGKGHCKYLFGNDWGLVFNLLIISHLAMIKTQKKELT